MQFGSQKRSFADAFYLFLCGICMGAADLVPGISGGTIAFIMGFYQPLLESIKTLNVSAFKLLISFKFRAFSEQVAWKFLLQLLLGIGVAFCTLASLFHFILGHEVYRVYFYALFMGLITASFVFCLRQISRWTLTSLLALLIGIVSAYCLTGTISFLNKNQQTFAVVRDVDVNYSNLINYDYKQKLLTDLSKETLEAMLARGLLSSSTTVYDKEGQEIGKVANFVGSSSFHRISPWLMLCGAIAISAMLLPGISGSYLLTLLGVYSAAIGALADLLTSLGHLTVDWEAFWILANLFIGIVIGVLLFARFVSWLLRQFPHFTVALLAGFMIGALRSVWPFWSYAYALLPLKPDKGAQLIAISPIWPEIHSTLFLFSLLFALGGFNLVFVLEWLASLKQRASKKPGIKIAHEQEL